MSQKLLAMKPLPPRVAECTVQSADARADAGSKGRARGPAGRCSPTPGSRRPVPPCSTAYTVLESPSAYRIPEGRRSSTNIRTATDSCKQQAAQEQIVREQEMRAQAERGFNFDLGDANGDGRIDFAEFCSMNCVQGRSNEELKRLYQKLDINRDSKFDKKESRLRKFEEQLFASADQNNDLALDFKEFSMLRCNKGRSEQDLRQIFSTLDENHDETIDLDELCTKEAGAKQASGGIREADAKEEQIMKQQENQEKNTGHTLVPRGCKR
jgi:Ca2+-binding EF-hand superfamily protein